MRSPFELLEAMAREEVRVTPDLRHLEIYTLRGLLTILWHGPAGAPSVVLMSGGGMGGLLGPAGGLYHDLGSRFAESGIATMRVGYRRPNDLGRCVHDVAAAADLGASAVRRQAHAAQQRMAAPGPRQLRRALVRDEEIAAQRRGNLGLR